MMTRLNLRNSQVTPAPIAYGTNWSNVTVVNPLVVGVDASLTVKRIGSVLAIATAPPFPAIETVICCVGRKFLPLAITSIEVIVPAALTLAESSARVGSGPRGSEIVTFGGAGALKNHRLSS